MATLGNPNRPWFVYIRVSTEDQGLKYGPARQVEAIQNWFRLNEPNALVPGLDSCVINTREVRRSEYIGFDTQTGKNDARPDYQRGYELVRAGKVAGFIAARLDRVARNAEDALLLRSRLKRMGTRLECATQKFDDTPAGDLMYGMYAQFAEFEGKLILERTAEGRIGRVRDEKLFMSNKIVPYGYSYVDAEVQKKHPGAKRGSVVINEEEAAVVRKMFNMYLLPDVSIYSVMAWLNQEGITTRQGKPWWRQTVASILQRADRYAGTYTVRLGIEAAEREYRERVKLMGRDAAMPLDLSRTTLVELPIEPLISRETARRIRLKLSANKKSAAGRPNMACALAKKVYCAFDNGNGACGSVWYFKLDQRRNHNIYLVGRCSKKVHCNGGPQNKKCNCRRIRASELERSVMAAIKEYLGRPEVAYAAAMQAYEEERGTCSKGRRETMEANLAKLREQQEYFGDIILNPAQKKLHAKANARFADLEVQIEALERDLRRTPLAVVHSKKGLVESFTQKLQLLDTIDSFEDRREFFEDTVQRIDFDGEEAVITGKIQIPLAGKSAPNCNSDQDRDFNLARSIPFVIKTKVA
jgi:DNA invertase Pin-like site-specific DNA recombinase